MRTFFAVIAVLLTVGLLSGCVAEGESLSPIKIQPATDDPTGSVASPPTQVSLVTTTPLSEVQKEHNTVVFKQDTGFAVNGTYQGQNFTVTYSGGGLSYYVTIDATTENDYRQIKKKAEETFSQRGLQDLCSIRLVFIPSRNLTNLNPADGRAAGC